MQTGAVTHLNIKARFCRGFAQDSFQADVEGDVVPGRLPRIGQLDGDQIGAGMQQIDEGREIEISNGIPLVTDGFNA